MCGSRGALGLGMAKSQAGQKPGLQLMALIAWTGYLHAAPFTKYLGTSRRAGGTSLWMWLIGGYRSYRGAGGAVQPGFLR